MSDVGKLMCENEQKHNHSFVQNGPEDVKITWRQAVSVTTTANTVPCPGTIVPCLRDSGGSIDTSLNAIYW